MLPSNRQFGLISAMRELASSSRRGGEMAEAALKPALQLLQALRQRRSRCPVEGGCDRANIRNVPRLIAGPFLGKAPFQFAAELRGHKSRHFEEAHGI